MSEEKLRKTALWGICIAIAIAFLWAFLKYLFPVLLPFLLSYAASRCILPIARWLCRKTKIPEKIWAAVIIVAFSAAVTYLTWTLGSIVVKEAVDAVASLGDMISDENSVLSVAFGKIPRFFGKFSNSSEKITETVVGMLNAALNRISEGAAAAAGSFISVAPSVIFTVIVVIISLFYFALDTGKITAEIKKYLSPKAENALTRVKRTSLYAGKRFVRAYLIIMAITFSELLIGFLIIDISYPFLAALIVAIVDILPVFGAGTVIVPWAVILFLSGETAKAAGMLALAFVMYVIRQLIEPKIVGDSAGVHPLLALGATFAGFKLAGIGGMIIGPVILNILCAFRQEKS